MAIVAWAVSLALLLLWPNREHADQWTLIFIALGTFVVLFVVVLWVSYRQPPRLLRDRPGRYLIPSAVGLMAASTWLTWISRNGPSDWALPGWALFGALILLGDGVAIAWWASAPSEDPPVG